MKNTYITTKKTTAESLGEVIDYLTEAGYKFKRLDEIDYYDTAVEQMQAENEMIL